MIGEVQYVKKRATCLSASCVREDGTLLEGRALLST